MPLHKLQKITNSQIWKKNSQLQKMLTKAQYCIWLEWSIPFTTSLFSALKLDRVVCSSMMTIAFMQMKPHAGHGRELHS